MQRSDGQAGAVGFQPNARSGLGHCHCGGAAAAAAVCVAVSSSITAATNTPTITITPWATSLAGWMVARSVGRLAGWRPPSALALHGVSAHLGTRQGDTAFVEEGLLCITLSTCCLSSFPFFTSLLLAALQPSR